MSCEFKMNNIEYTGHRLMEEYPTYTRISWNALEECNYNCWYCYLGNSKRSKLITDTEFGNLIDNILLNFSDREYIKFVITGGEPTYYDLKLFEFIDSLLKIQNIKEIIIHTNFSKPLSWWKLFASKYAGKPVEVNATCHLEYVSSDKDILEFIDKLVLLNNNNVRVFTWIMIDQNNKDVAISIRKRINTAVPEKTNFKFIQHPNTLNFYEKNKQFVFSDKKNVVLKYINNDNKLYLNADELIIENYNKYLGLICTRGINQIAIDAYGAVYTSECQWVLDKIPEIEAPGFYSKNCILNIKPTICYRQHCKHPSDIYIPKYNIKSYVKKFKHMI